MNTAMKNIYEDVWEEILPLVLGAISEGKNNAVLHLQEYKDRFESKGNRKKQVCIQKFHYIF